ncbi:MAG: flagellar basal body-associated FliL family protein [Planctomycetes bacterium]|nr:flagellar basal body-associated FliL family protein [Planctomycetota bacterium]
MIRLVPTPGVGKLRGLAMWSRLGLLCLGAVLLAVGGCSGPAPFDFDALGLVTSREDLTEFSLGRYAIPIPIVVDSNSEQPKRSNRFQFDFELHALVEPGRESQIAEVWERHEGELRDQVIRVCRKASVAELQDPELGALKSHLADLVQAQLGEVEVKQVLITEVMSQEL